MDRELGEEKSRDHMGSSGGFCYPEVSPNNHPSIHNQFMTPNHQIQDFDDHDHHDEHDHDQPSNPSHHDDDQIFSNLQSTGMDQMISFSSKNTTNTTSSSSASAAVMWKGFNSDQTTNRNHHHHHHQNLMATTVGPDHHHQSWGSHQDQNRFLLDDSSVLRSCVFPCEGNERPSQGLSLSLSSTNPSSIGLQTFELIRHIPNNNQTQEYNHGDFFGKLPANIQVNDHQDHHFLHHQQSGGSGQMFHLRNSRYLSPAQGLLNEFCSLGTKQISTELQKQKSSQKNKQQWEDQDNSNINNNDINGASSSKKPSLYSLEFMELQKRKTKLLSMLEEVERRYKNYCDQMKTLVSSFEAVAGVGAATVYSALASKAMSRHFRCLKDGIVSQIQATRKAMGEKDVAAPGTSRGETPRLRVLDQALRQQRAFQQMSMMESHPWRPQRGLPERSVSVLRAWLFEHFLHPYPSDVDKHILARQTGLSRSQVSNWFINARVRLWKPMVEEMYLEETKEHLDPNNNNNIGSSSDGVTMDLGDPSQQTTGRNPPPERPDHDQKPTADQLVRIDSECLSSIVINPEKTDVRSGKTLQAANPSVQVQRQQNFGRFPETAFGTMELDFSSYNQHQPSSGLYHNDGTNGGLGFSSGGSGGGGVSLTLGLQQHAGASHGVSLAFSPASQSSLFYPRDHHDQIDECQPGVQYSLLDGEGQNLPYRNLMGAQLLQDLA